jgi:hypothetical protein
MVEASLLSELCCCCKDAKRHESDYFYPMNLCEECKVTIMFRFVSNSAPCDNTLWVVEWSESKPLPVVAKKGDYRSDMMPKAFRWAEFLSGWFLLNVETGFDTLELRARSLEQICYSSARWNWVSAIPDPDSWGPCIRLRQSSIC